MNKKYIYIGLASLSLIGIGYLLLGGKKKDDKEDDKPSDGEDQEKIPTNVKQGIKVGTSIYAKLNSATKVRNSAEVNNGLINNIWFEIPDGNSGLLLGKVNKVYKQASSGYTWYRFDVSQPLWTKYRDEQNFITRPFNEKVAKGFSKWIREDVIK